MERLTKKDKNGFLIIPNEQLIKQTEVLGRYIDKLGQLEDLEEELGIDLITLFKALKNGVYIKFFCGCSSNFGKTKKAKFTERVLHFKATDIHIPEKTITFEVFDKTNNSIWNGGEEEVLIKDYRKTWFLTREELERWARNLKNAKQRVAHSKQTQV